MRSTRYIPVRIRLIAGFACLAAAALCPTRAPAQEMALPVSVQIPVFTKMLAFDRDLPSRAGDEIVIGILHQGGYRASQLAAEEVRRALNGTHRRSIAGIPLRYVSLDYSVTRSLDMSLSDLGIDVLYVAPLRAVDIDEITTATRARGVLTCTGVADYVDLGVAIGLSVRRDRPLILVNLPAALAEGADFSSELLKLAEVIDLETGRS